MSNIAQTFPIYFTTIFQSINWNRSNFSPSSRFWFKVTFQKHLPHIVTVSCQGHWLQNPTLSERLVTKIWHNFSKYPHNSKDCTFAEFHTQLKVQAVCWQCQYDILWPAGLAGFGRPGNFGCHRKALEKISDVPHPRRF